MSDFRFACVHCGQRISCDAGYRGMEINCPACAQKLTVPAIRAVAPVATAAGRAALTGVPTQAESAAAASAKTSHLALASLVCSLVLGVGCIPGIICGHLARGRLRRDPALRGRQMAMGGLVLSYFFLLASLAVVATGYLVLSPKYGHQLSPTQSAANTPSVLATRRVDEVEIGNADSESLHAVRLVNSESSTSNGRTFRDAYGGGSISYVMKVDPARPMTLYCTYWGNDSLPGNRLFDILVDNEVIARQKLDNNAPGHFFDVEYQIPKRLTDEKHQVVVRFQAGPGMIAGGLYGCQTLRR